MTDWCSQHGYPEPCDKCYGREMMAEKNVEQVRMERWVQPSGTPIKLRQLEVSDGCGYPYTVERCVRDHWQQRSYGLSYAQAVDKFNGHRKFERSIRSRLALLGGD